MLFEEIKTKIESGDIGSLEDIAEMLRVLTVTRRRSGVYIALALFESRRLYRGPRWSFWAAKEYELTDEKDALHRANIGEMLRAMEQRDPARHKRFMELTVAFLLVWTKLFNAGKSLQAAGSIDNPFVPLNNFIKLRPDAFGWKRETLDREIKLFLNPDQEFEQPELALTFDAVGSLLEDDQIAALTASEQFDGVSAFTMAANGAKLCNHAVKVILKDNDMLTVEALADIDNTLEAAHRELRAMLIRKRTAAEPIALPAPQPEEEA